MSKGAPQVTKPLETEIEFDYPLLHDNDWLRMPVRPQVPSEERASLWIYSKAALQRPCHYKAHVDAHQSRRPRQVLENLVSDVLNDARVLIGGCESRV